MHQFAELQSHYKASIHVAALSTCVTVDQSDWEHEVLNAPAQVGVIGHLSTCSYMTNVMQASGSNTAAATIIKCSLQYRMLSADM